MHRLICFLIALMGVVWGGLWVNDSLNEWLVTASSASSTYKTYRLFALRPADEIPILGSSRASQNFVPSLLSSKAFNYGVDGSGMGESLFFLEQCLRNGSAGPILINLDPWGFPKKTSFAADYQLVLSNAEVRAVLPPERTACLERLWGVRFHGALRRNLTAFLNDRLALTKIVDHGATLQRLSRTLAEWEIINQSRSEPVAFHFDAHWQARLDALYGSTKRPIVWVVGPLAPHPWRLYRGMAELEAFLATQVKRKHVYAVNLIRLSEEMTEADFMDPTHLNLQGAERFTRLLRERLMAIPEVAETLTPER